VAAPSIREPNWLEVDEKYCTLLGHLSHEVGHFHWDRLIRVDGRLRALYCDCFDDERRKTKYPIRGSEDGCGKQLESITGYRKSLLVPFKFLGASSIPWKLVTLGVFPSKTSDGSELLVVSVSAGLAERKLARLKRD